MKHLSIASVRCERSGQSAVPRLESYGATGLSRPAAYQIALRQLGCLQALACRLAVAIEAAAGDDSAHSAGSRACTEERRFSLVLSERETRAFGDYFANAPKEPLMVL